MNEVSAVVIVAFQYEQISKCPETSSNYFTPKRKCFIQAVNRAKGVEWLGQIEVAVAAPALVYSSVELVYTL